MDGFTDRAPVGEVQWSLAIDLGADQNEQTQRWHHYNLAYSVSTVSQQCTFIAKNDTKEMPQMGIICMEMYKPAIFTSATESSSKA